MEHDAKLDAELALDEADSEWWPPAKVRSEVGRVRAERDALRQDLNDARNGWERSTERVRELELAIATGGAMLRAEYLAITGKVDTRIGTKSIEELLERSSLGTPHAKRMRAQVSPEVVDRVLQRVDEIERVGRVDWHKMTPNQAHEAFEAAPPIAGPWTEQGPGIWDRTSRGIEVAHVLRHDCADDSAMIVWDISAGVTLVGESTATKVVEVGKASTVEAAKAAADVQLRAAGYVLADEVH